MSAAKKKEAAKKAKANKKKGSSAPPVPQVKEWTAAIDRTDFLEIASLRRVLLSGVSLSRHTMGLVHPVSVFTTKAFDSLFWYKRHGSGVQQYDFKHLVDVIPVNSAQSVGDAFPQALVEMTRSGQYEGDLAARAFVMIFSVPLSQVELAGADESVAARQGADQQASFYSGGGGGEDEEFVQLAVDFVCDNQWSYESLLEGFSLLKDNYSDLLNSPEFGKLQDVGGINEGGAAGGPGNDDDRMRGLESAASNAVKKLGKDEKSGKHTGATQAMNTLHQLYQPEHHPNHRAKFKIKAGTEVEVMYKPNAYQCWYSKRKCEEVEVDLKGNKYFKPGKYCLGVIRRRYKDDTYDVAYSNGPFQMDEDPNHSMKPLFPRRGLLFKRVPKAFLIVDYDAQLASRFPYAIGVLSLAQTLYFAYYVSTHASNEQGEVSPWVGVAGDSSLYLQSMGKWPGCENLIWAQEEYWRLGSYQMVHFGLNHIGFNMLAQVLFGTPIERVHGTFRVMLLYQLGVVGAALFAGWTDPMKIVVGASGGVYTILGAHWANMAISWDAMKNGTVPPFARMFVLSTLMGIDLVQYFFYRAGGTSYAVHLGGWLIGFVGGIVVLRDLEVDFWETWVLRPLAVLTFVVLVAYSLWWDTTHWPPVRPNWVAAINFGDGTRQCCWKVWECKDFALEQQDKGGADYLDTEANGWGPEQWDDLRCSGYDVYGDYADDDGGGLTTCESMYNYVFHPSDDQRVAELAELDTTGGTSAS